MKTMRMILFVQLLAFSALASTTKVGNGDDGGDLEALTPIKSGPLHKTRDRALALARKLNVEGIFGMGLLVPEIERTEMFLAAADVRPAAESAGSLEVSEDHKLVYARTFAEPAAPTRFFPAALTLSEDQMVALHIHEALHRALPEGIREKEDVVMHLTLAMASPGANHDRVRQIAGLYVQPRAVNAVAVNAVAMDSVTPVTVAAPAESVMLPEKSRITAGYSIDAHSASAERLSAPSPLLQGLEFSTRLANHKMIFGYAVEPVFRARLKIFSPGVQRVGGRSSLMGQSSYDLRGRVRVDEDSHAGPFLRFTTQSLDEPESGRLDRDVTSLGFSYDRQSISSYGGAAFTYSLPSTAHRADLNVSYSAIMSLNFASGFRWGKFKLGGLAEMHNSEGTEASESYSYSQYSYDYQRGRRAPFRLLVAGPEIAYESERFQLRAYLKRVMNETNASLDDLGDVVDRGGGSGGMGTSVTMFF